MLHTMYNTTLRKNRQMILNYTTLTQIASAFPSKPTTFSKILKMMLKNNVMPLIMKLEEGHLLINKSVLAGFYQSTFVYSCFFLKIQFFTVCLVQWLCGMAQWQTRKGKFSKFRSADCRKMHFSCFFLRKKRRKALKKKLEEKLTGKIQSAFLYACFQVSKPKSKKNRRI